MEQRYDSTADTLAHIARVREHIARQCAQLVLRGRVHDLSKLGPEEKPHRDLAGPHYRTSPRGSAEFVRSRFHLAPAVRHHYAANRHHIEHHGDTGISGMTLVDLVEMFCDWSAACESYVDGDIVASIKANAEKYGINPQLAQILLNSVEADAEAVFPAAAE